MESQELYVYTRYGTQANVNWVDTTGEESFVAFYEANKHLITNLKNLRICPKCFRLRGLVILEDGYAVKQKCACYWPLKENKWQVKLAGRNYYYDFNELHEICYCCGLEVIPSGSKWSLFYCRDCKARIRKLNEMIGRCIIPYGRHSLMNGVSLSGKNAKDREAINLFVAATNGMNQDVDIVERHRKAIAKKWGELLQLGNDASAIDLVLKSEGVELDELKKESFVELLALTFGRTIDEAKRFYQDFLEHR
jgi:hypothetical protein